MDHSPPGHKVVSGKGSAPWAFMVGSESLLTLLSLPGTTLRSPWGDMKKKKKRRIHMETASKVDVPTSSLHLPWHQAVLLFLAISSLYRGNSLKASKPSLSSKSFRTRHGIQNPQPVSTALVFQTTQHQVQSSDQLFTSNYPLQEEEEKQ